MTAAYVQTEPACPKCGGKMWDKKNDAKYPWKPGTPIWKCRTKECATAGGVIWEPKTNGSPPIAKSNEKKPVSYGTPGFLEGAESEDAAELQAKIAEPDEAAVMLQSYLDLTAWVLKRMPEVYEKAKIGMSPESAAACVHTLFIEANKRRLVGRVK